MTFQMIRDHLSHVLFHNSVEAAEIAPASVNHDANDDSFLTRYLLALVLVVLFWPVLLTLVAASVSASAWLFWLLIGAVFGLLQLLYVLYNFIMITIDLGGLTLLKSFALIRSYVRYYTYKMTDAAGIDIKSRKRREKKFRRRKEWREDVEKAKTYEEYCQIELYEPQPSEATQNPRRSVMRISSRGTEITNNSPISPLSRFGLKKRHGKSPKQDEQQQSTKIPRRSPITSINASLSSSPSRHIRKIHSCLDFKDSPGNRVERLSKSQPVKRTSSTASLPNDHSQDEDDQDHDCPTWQKVVREDLGMAGDMLLTTMARLREARLQASSTNDRCEANSDGANGNEANEDGKNNDAGIIQDEDTNGNNSYHITSFSSSSSDKRHNEDYSSSLKFLLSGIIKRNHLSVDDALINDCRSVAERGQHSLRKETRDAIDRYGEEVERCLEWVASGPIFLDAANNQSHDDAKGGISQLQVMQRQLDELDKRYTLVKRMKQNMGHTALMLSGGGAIAMYHLGTIKALVESRRYEQIHVISGTSGGSIAAAMCAIKSPAELLRDICVNTVSTDYMLTGEMKRQKIRWFPELLDMGRHWLKNGVLADSSEFKRCCDFYYKDITFEEAFEMTHKHVCITVTASRANAGSGVQRLLLNHISTPNVTLASAVAASCSLPGFMKPTKLMIKDSRGKQVPFEVDGVEWIDGSVQADLPFKRISTLFNVSNFVVAQVNFHVVPFLNKAHHPNINTLYWKLFQICMWDIGSRVLNLSSLGLFPKLFGQDVTKVFKQKYYGNLTLVPRFTTMHLFGLKAFQNPTVADMDIYLQDGQIAAWPYLRVLKEMLRIEGSIDECLRKLKTRINSIETGSGSEHLLHGNDDDDSLSLSSAVGAAYRARLPGLGREAELLKEKNNSLIQEVMQLRRQVARYQRALGISHTTTNIVECRSGTLVGKSISVSRVDEEEDVDLIHLMEEKKSS
eukprot:CCRYP_020604-RC/>CCRYP_020604-RC protein AED:0.05 eAED:0.05 QI:234/1/1/1/0.83/0.71/7/170/964